MISTALSGWQSEGIALCDESEANIAHWIEEEIGGFLKLTMGRYPDGARKEFCDQCTVEFAAVPLSILTDAVRLARREVSYPEKLVPYVFGVIGDRLAKFEAEGSRLHRLAEIAGV